MLDKNSMNVFNFHLIMITLIIVAVFTQQTSWGQYLGYFVSSICMIVGTASIAINPLTHKNLIQTMFESEKPFLITSRIININALMFPISVVILYSFEWYWSASFLLAHAFFCLYTQIMYIREAKRRAREERILSNDENT